MLSENRRRPLPPSGSLHGRIVFVAELRALLAQFSPRPLDVSKLPSQLRDHLVSKNGTYALYINPKPPHGPVGLDRSSAHL